MFPFLPWYFLTLAKEDSSHRKNIPSPASHLRSPMLPLAPWALLLKPLLVAPLLLSISPPYSFPLRLLSLLVLILFRVPPYPCRSTQVARRPSHWLRRCFYTSPASHAVFPSVVVRPREARRMLLVYLIYEALSEARAFCCALSRFSILAPTSRSCD